MNVLKADKRHLDELSRLFNLYRQFYDYPADFDAAKSFMSDRIKNSDSTIFIAENDGELVGFTQMYPSFCSVDVAKIFILYDLYVDESARGSGVAASLMNKAKEYAIENGAKRIDLLTAVDNHPGQKLYEKLGYQRVLDDFLSYSLNV
ncbi:GNAT family N-acetyltransferase [Microbulbifer agarilyticus]|uniref:GNAT family N-acetyltransferase n=1 Tax=Microbulbifer agarilyticus TaxID=260552 RepID=A0A1Q2M372_9GAMM|nr:GNAT family N-acetyltransferase [Microbulbifer agarilyticus]AQQ67099.1 GNAT family N-acetyltransferase [Microbulbifer agarilyticus]